MKTRLSGPHAGAAVLVAGLVLSGSVLAAAPTRVVRRGAPGRAVAPSAAAVSYSVEVPVVTRIVGTALFRTALDISNNTSAGTTAAPVVARFQYSYNRVVDGVTSFFRTPIQTLNLLAFDNFHTDDFVQYLGTLPGVLQPGAETSSFGTLLVTFENLPSSQGWEGTVFARTYSAATRPGVGTVAIAYPGSLFFESANSTLVATIRDTQLAPTVAGALRTNVGIRNTDIRGPDRTSTSSWSSTTSHPATQRTARESATSSPSGSATRTRSGRSTTSGRPPRIPNNVTAMLVFADVAAQRRRRPRSRATSTSSTAERRTARTSR